uniref:Chromosome 8 open reading frame 34 n=1 Tax=Hippocampus comes TaxID=109280 RepID=A0A3Q2XNY5_HIPCM
MASPQQSRIQSYLERNKIGPLFEELMTKLISETPDRPIPFLIDHLQSKQDSPGKMHRALSGSAALWAQSSPESKNTRRELRHNDRPWQIHPRKPKKSKSDLAVSSLSPPSPESNEKSLKTKILCPSWDWRDSRDLDELNHILLESKKLGRALESLSHSETAHSFSFILTRYNSVLRPRVVGEWIGRAEEDADPLAAEMLRPPVPRVKNDVCWSRDGLPLASLKTVAKGSKGLMEQQQHHRKLLADMLSQESLNPLRSLTPCVGDDEMDVDDDDDDAMELLEDLDDLRMEGVTGLAPSGCKFSQGRSSYHPEPQAKVTLNICSRCARLQGDSLATSRSQEALRPHASEQAVPDISCERQETFHLSPRLLHRVSSFSQPRCLGWTLWRRAGLVLGDPLFSKELENMGKQLAEVEKDLAKLAEVGKMTVRNNPHGSLVRGPLGHRSLPDTLPLTSLLCRPRSPSGGLSGKACPGSSSLRPGGRAFSNPGSRTHTPGTPDSLRSGFNAHKEVTFRRSRSRPVTPTRKPAHTRPLLTPPGLSTTDSLGASLRAYLAEDEFYQQLQAIRQPWHIPSDTDSDIMEPPEQDKSE